MNFNVNSGSSITANERIYAIRPLVKGEYSDTNSKCLTSPIVGE
jgi:hypothetical protein